MASNFAEALFQGRNDAISSRLGQQQAQRKQQRFDMGMQKEERALETDKRKALYDLASGYKSFIAKNPQGGQQYYETFLKPSLAGLGLGDAGPYDPAAVESVADQVIAAYGGQQQGAGVQSTYIDNQGNRVAIMRDGTTQVLGQNAPSNQIIDTGNGFYGVNKGNLQAAPVVVGGAPAPAQPSAQRQGTTQDADAVASRLNAYRDQLMAAGVQGPQLDAVLSAAEQQLFGAMPEPPVAQAPQGNQLRSAPKPTAAPSGYRALPDGNLAPIPGGPAQIAIDARADAAAAKRAAEDVKKQAKQQELNARQAEATNATDQLLTAIDTLATHPGFQELGTATGDLKLNTPLIRSDVKDANAMLKNIGGQVALSTMARLKSLSAQGATGFGALSAPELRLLENAIATLQADEISNQQLTSSLETIRNTLERTKTWRPPAEQAEVAPDEAGWSIEVIP